MNIDLNTHPIWDEFDRMLTQMDTKALGMEHLAACNYTVNGYWDGDEFYEEIAFVHPLRAELANRSLDKTQIDHHSYRRIRLQFVLKSDTSSLETEPASDQEEIGELTLVLDPSWRIIDENWLINVESPFVVAKKAQDY
jgi:hypothetical protein